MEKKIDSMQYYKALFLYNRINYSLDTIADAGEFWSTISSHCPVYVDTTKDTNYLNDLFVPHVMEPEYWDRDFTLNDPTLCTLAQSVLHEC